MVGKDPAPFGAGTSEPNVTLDTSHEYFGAMMLAREIMFIRELLVDLGEAPSGPSVIFSDSASAVDMSFDPVAFKNTKHIMRDSNFLRDLVAREVVILSHVKGTTMLADILTKAVARPTFLVLMRLLDDFPSAGDACPST